MMLPPGTETERPAVVDGYGMERIGLTRTQISVQNWKRRWEGSGEREMGA